jgi:hypothetical protein
VLIAPDLKLNGNLGLTGYSFQAEELQSVPRVLMRLGITFLTQPAKRDTHQRLGISWHMDKTYVAILEKSLGLRFWRSNELTRLDIFPSRNDGPHFRCQEISRSGDGKGCENISAHDQHEALLICALLARERHWFGGNAAKGTCGSW